MHAESTDFYLTFIFVRLLFESVTGTRVSSIKADIERFMVSSRVVNELLACLCRLNRLQSLACLSEVDDLLTESERQTLTYYSMLERMCHLIGCMRFDVSHMLGRMRLPVAVQPYASSVSGLTDHNYMIDRVLERTASSIERAHDEVQQDDEYDEGDSEISQSQEQSLSYESQQSSDMTEYKKQQDVIPKVYDNRAFFEVVKDGKPDYRPKVCGGKMFEYALKAAASQVEE